MEAQQPMQTNTDGRNRDFHNFVTTVSKCMREIHALEWSLRDGVLSILQGISFLALTETTVTLRIPLMVPQAKITHCFITHLLGYRGFLLLISFFWG
jgi:hypothetical protein